jgi:hypothetical protein
VSPRMTPSSPHTASKASVDPASDPVCAIAAARPASDCPSLMATIDLPAARAMRRRRESHGVGERLHIDDDDAEFRFAGEECVQSPRSNRFRFRS